MWRRTAKKNGPKAARATYGYVRVSTEAQSREGVSLAAQEARLRAFCAGTNRQLGEIITDAGISAKTTKRPGLQRILEGVRAGEVGTVVVYSLSRATRSVRDLADLLELFQRHDVAFVSVTENLDTSTAMGRAMVGFTGVLAQLEREQIGERTSEALAHKRQTKQVYGRVPFGYERQGNKLIPVASEQRALNHIRKMDAQGVSYRRIAAWLSEHGHSPKNGAKVWYAASVRKLLLSKMNTESAA